MDKIISFSGIERGDFVYYMAALLNKAGKAVLVLDNSQINDIFNAVNANLDVYYDTSKAQDFVVKQNITYMKNIKYDPSIELPFDYVLIWHGVDMNMEMASISDLVYLLPDYRPGVLLRMKKAIGDQTDIVTKIIMRDSVESNKITEKSAADLLGVDAEKVKHILIYDNKNYENYLSFLYNGRATFSVLSSEYVKALQEVGMDILDVDSKEIKKIYSRSIKTK